MSEALLGIPLRIKLVKTYLSLDPLNLPNIDLNRHDVAIKISKSIELGIPEDLYFKH